MSGRKLAKRLILGIAGLIVGSAVAAAQEAGGVPTDVSATRTKDGVLLISRAQGNEFSLLVKGSEIVPLSSVRLKLRIDGREVEIVTAASPPGQWSMPATINLVFYQMWARSRFEKEGWDFVASESSSLAGGKRSISWRMRRQISGRASPERRIVLATINQHNIVALVGSVKDPDTEGATNDFLRAVLSSLRAEKPTQSPTDAAAQRLDEGTDLQQGLEEWRALTGRELRALLNEQLMTEADNSLAEAVPVKPAVLLQGLLQVCWRRLQFPAAIVFDGKSAHAIVVISCDPKRETFTYFDPWDVGSFLAAGSNLAGVAAVPDPTRERLWIVKAEQLERVIYAVELEFDDVLKLSAAMPLDAFGALGERLEDAKRTDLFRWFHLERTASSKDAAGHQVLTFRPADPRFRPLASLDLTMDPAARLLAADLQLRRTFIADRTHTVFARQLAKSFLITATSERDLAWLGPLVNQIEFAVPGHPTAFLAKAPEANLPEHPIDEYLVFLGDKPSAVVPLSLTRLRLANIGTDETATLLISLETFR
jgi:hypothetical protein